MIKKEEKITQKSRRFYNNEVAPMVHDRFPAYEARIAVGIVGEGSDCFGYDDLISRDHDFGTGVCLWLMDKDYREIGNELAAVYNRLADSMAGPYFTDRLRERRGVMTIHDFYSNILLVDCDTDSGTLPEEKWYKLDHSCLATAVNGEVFRDDLGVFSAFRNMLLHYYPEPVFRWRLADELHRFSQALQVNYARCMTRKDTVAAELCRLQGIKAAMEIFFLMKRKYPPYYKWTYRALRGLDETGEFSDLVKNLSETGCDLSAWEKVSYHPDSLNMEDRVVALTERIAGRIVKMMREQGLVREDDPYLERYVDVVLLRK